MIPQGSHVPSEVMTMDAESAVAMGALAPAPASSEQAEAQPAGDVGDRWVVMLRWLDAPRQLAH
jgi:hypothetical protein